MRQGNSGVEQLNRFTSPFAKNSAWIVVEQIYRIVFSFIVSVLTARYLGPSNMGILTYAATFVAAFLPISLLGLDQITVSEIVKTPEKTDVILGSGIFMRAIAGLLCWITIILLVYVLKQGDLLFVTVAGLNAISLVLYSMNLTESWLQANLRSKYATITKSIAYTVMSLYKVYLLVTGKSIVWFAVSTSLDVALIALLYYIVFFRRGQVKFNVKLDMMKRLISLSYPFIFSGLMIVVYGQIERVVLEQYYGSAALGNYGIGLSIAYTWRFVPAAVIISARPLLLGLRSKNNMLFYRRLKQLFAFVWWLGIIASVAFTLSADWMIGLMYGEAYTGAATALKIVTWSQGFSLIGGVRDIWFIAEGKNRLLIQSQCLSAVFALLVYFTVIPRFGLAGAAASVVLVQFFVAIISTLPNQETRICSKLIIEAMLFRF